MANHLERVGQQLGNYRLIQLVGQGSFADVYLGEHSYLGTQVAIKILQTRLTTDDVERFRAEARTIAGLKHPHIVRVLDFGVEEGTPYFVMSYAPNGSLRQRHPRGTRLPLETIVAYVKQVADALQYAHQRTLIHGDIKPENMLLGTNSEILLSDFGAATLGPSSRNRDIEPAVGTIHYMAPEQIQGKPQLASDQYALGVVVYEWLCGEFPFSGSFTEVATQHLFTPPPPLREKVPMLPPAVEEVVLRALDKDPQQRFVNIRSFADALEQANKPELSTIANMLSASPVAPYTANTLIPSQSRAQSKRHLSRRNVVVGLVGLAGLSLAGGSITWLVRSQQSQKSLSSTHLLPPTPTSLPLGTLLLTYQGHSEIVESVAWSPDNKRIASASYDKTVQIWDAETGQTILTYRGHSDSVWSVAWSPDGSRIASASGNLVTGHGDTTVHIWNATTGELILTYYGHSWMVWSVAWSPDGKRIASGSGDQTIQIWDASTGNLITTYRGMTRVWRAAWSPDGTRIVSGDLANNTVKVWDANTGNTLLTYRGQSGRIYSAVWSPDGKYIASGSYNDQTVQIWDALTGVKILTHDGQTEFGGCYTLAWSPDGKRIASGGESRNGRGIWVLDAETGNTLFPCGSYTDTVVDVAWSFDGKRLVSGSYDKKARVWKAE